MGWWFRSAGYTHTTDWDHNPYSKNKQVFVMTGNGEPYAFLAMAADWINPIEYSYFGDELVA